MIGDEPLYIQRSVVTNNVGRILESSFLNEFGQLESVSGGPANICYSKSGKVRSEQYCKNGKNHRLDGPAVICYYSSGRISQEMVIMILILE